MAVHVVGKQHGGGAGASTGGHIVDRVADHDQSRGVAYLPELRGRVVAAFLLSTTTTTTITTTTIITITVEDLARVPDGAQEAPGAGDEEQAGGVWLGRTEVAGDDGVEEMAVEELGEQVGDGGLEVAGADALADAAGVEVGHEGREAGLGDLLDHGAALDGADGLHGGLALRGRGQGVDVLQDVDVPRDLQDGAHLCEHVVLGLAEGEKGGGGALVNCILFVFDGVMRLRNNQNAI